MIFTHQGQIRSGTLGGWRGTDFQVPFCHEVVELFCLCVLAKNDCPVTIMVQEYVCNSVAARTA